MSLCDRLRKVYIYPENVDKIQDFIEKKLSSGEYDKHNAPDDFAWQIDKDLLSITNDKHLGFVYNPKMAAEMLSDSQGSNYTPSMIDEWKQNNYEFRELKILAGNVGYMDLREFCPVRFAGETAIAAMNFLSECSALMIDLRYNGGGEDEMVQFLLSYLIDPADTGIIFSTSYIRFNDTYYQSSVLPYVPGRKLYNTPVYLLVSKSTFSAAEAFSYNLKTLKRATLVGENTRGGENPIEIQVLDSNYVVYIPSTKLLKSISNTNPRWEGTGIKPDIEVDANEALKVAHIEALQMLLANTRNIEMKLKYQWAIDGIKLRSNQFSVNSDVLKMYEGKFRDYWIIFSGDNLYYERGGRAKMKMIPVEKDFFMVENLDDVRAKFIRENGKITELDFLMVGGRIIKCPKE